MHQMLSLDPYELSTIDVYILLKKKVFVADSV